MTGAPSKEAAPRFPAAYGDVIAHHPLPVSEAKLLFIHVPYTRKGVCDMTQDSNLESYLVPQYKSCDVHCGTPSRPVIWLLMFACNARAALCP